MDPLSKEQIAAIVAVLKSGGRITLLVLDEPAKNQSSAAANRRAFAIVFEREVNRTFETVVDLKTKSMLGVTHIPRPEDWPVMPVHCAGSSSSPAASSRAIRPWAEPRA